MTTYSSGSSYEPRPGPPAGWVTFKAWLDDEAERQGSTPMAIRRRVARGHYRLTQFNYVNARVIFVKL